jgi:alkylation response protein AidB-like acyl-CoA dehydrogenase
LDFAWSEEQQAFRREVVRFAQQELADDLIARDRNEEFSWDAWNKCARFGIHGLPIPQEYGGGGADVLTTVGALDALGYGCRDNGLIFSINAHMWSAEIPMLSFGTEAQKRKYLPKLVSGEFVGIHAMTEPMSGSDAFSLRTRAVRKGNCYVLNGSKTFISNAPVAAMVIVFANLDPAMNPSGVTAFIVDKGTPGLSVSKKLHKMGLRTSPMAELALEDCEIPAENLLGKEGGGQTVFTVSMEWERICIMAAKLGAMQQVHRLVSRDRQQDRADGYAAGSLASPPLPGRVAEEPGQASLTGSLDREAVHLGGVCADRARRDSDPRRLRLHDRISDRARIARCHLRKDLFRHIGDPGKNHRRL